MICLSNGLGAVTASVLTYYVKVVFSNRLQEGECMLDLCFNIAVGSRVRTTRENESIRELLTERAVEAKRWGVEGEVKAVPSTDRLTYEVKQDDGIVVCYDATEIEFI